jgi:hypothetical protein
LLEFLECLLLTFGKLLLEAPATLAILVARRIEFGQNVGVDPE